MSTNERPNLVTEQLDLRRRQIHRLCAVARISGYSSYSNVMYIGWTLDGRPVATQDDSLLSTNAQQSLETSRTAGLATISIPFSTLRPVTYVGAGAMRNFLNTNVPTEDVIEYQVIDTNRDEITVTFNELALLNAIVSAKSFWQDIPTTAVERVANAQKMYTVFIPDGGEKTGVGTALLFEPRTDIASNESTFKSFVVQTVSRLIAADWHETDPRQKRGYAQVAERYLTAKKAGGVQNALRFLRDSGLLTYNDEEVEQRAATIRNRVGKVLGFLKSIDVVTVADERIQMLQNPLLHYDLYELEMDQLFDLTEALYSLARKQLR